MSALVLVSIGLSSSSGCDESGVAVVSQSAGAYGRQEMLTAIERFSQSERSPEAFAELARTVASLDRRFNDTVRAEAERHLVMLALMPLEAHHELAPRERLEVLGLTVWPTALGVAPEAEESAWDYGERICRDALALECKYVVPEYRALVLDALVWERLHERAQDAVYECDRCKGQAAYRKALDTYTRYRDATRKAAATAEPLFEPSRWPKAGKHAASWTDGLLLEVRKSGPHVLAGVPLGAGELTAALRQARDEYQRLGVFIRASAPVSELRAVLEEAQAAGFFDVALQVRDHSYPFELSQYSVTTNPAGPSISVRDIDTVQVLVQALDAIAETSERAPRI